MPERDGSDYLRRESGLLLHPTSLPAPHGIGDLGEDARRFVDFLKSAGQRLWQILPLGPTGYGNSPYTVLSAMASNPLLISLDQLAEEGLLSPKELAGIPDFPADHVDYAAVEVFKLPRLQQAHDRFLSEANSTQQSEFAAYCRRNAFWLDDYALFMTLRHSQKGAPWIRWEHPLAARQPGALERSRREAGEVLSFHQFAQFQFHRQWASLRRYANEQGIRLVGDVPIFVALDSSDVWSRPELFHLDEKGQPTVVSGVPPDYYSKTGQRWGNPLYRWDVMAGEGYGWWIDRFQMALAQVDLVRIDHFRGFESYWEVPARYKTAERGQWVKGPGESLFRALEDSLGRLPVIAEDLGLITPEVEALRQRLGFPGMKVLQFAFDGGARNPHLPHNLERRCAVYTGTHDNDTTVGWFQARPPKTRSAVLRYLATEGNEIHWDLLRLAFASVADVAMAPLQDVLGLGSAARMNLPGQPEGNWTWRFTSRQLQTEHADRLRQMTTTYERG